MCSNELLLRNTIIQKVISGRAMVDSFCLPETVAGSDRIGDDPKILIPMTPELVNTPSGSPPINQTQESPGVRDTPVDDATLADTCPDALPMETSTVSD